jgi:hypothetical protein
MRDLTNLWSYAIILFILGSNYFYLGQANTSAAKLTDDVEEQKALISTGKRRIWIGGILIAVAVSLTLSIIGAEDREAFTSLRIYAVLFFVLLLLYALRRSRQKRPAPYSPEGDCGDADRLFGNVPFVLYLRCFAADGTKPPSSPLEYFRWGLGAVDVVFVYKLLTSTTSEQQLVRSLSAVGPVVALARSKQDFYNGARRLLTQDAEWQPKVSSMLHACRLVVFDCSRIWEAQGLWWELEETFKIVPWSRVIIYLQFDDIDEGVR